VLSDVDVLLLTDVFAAGEQPIAGADGRALARAVRSRGRVEPIFIEDLDALPEALRSVLQPDDVVLTLGAGSIGAMAQRLLTELAVKGPVGVRR
jgi:UDP-N-acetylmuramate--alanine ligase